MGLNTRLEQNLSHTFLRGGGEMGELIRNKDWSKTELGDPAKWPQPLKTMVGVMLENPFAMYIAWGKEYTQLYNDGYRPILGQNKHPQALGISTKETFSEIWHIIGDMFNDVMDGKAFGFPDFELDLHRNGYLETCYFDFAYSPIRLENGEVGGVLVTVIETTSEKKAQIEIKDRKDELEFVIEAAQLGTFDYNPITNKFSGNKRLKNWFGLPPDDEIDLNDAIKVIADNDKDRVSQAISEALNYDSGGRYDIEYSIINSASGKEIIVHAKGHVWFNENCEAYRMTGTLEDITERTLANRKSREKEQHIRAMVSDSPIGICVIDADTLLCEIINDSFIEIVNKPRKEIEQHYFWDFFSTLKPLHSKALDGVISTGKPYFSDEVELLKSNNGTTKTAYVNLVYAPLKDEDNKVVKVAVWVLDNTAQAEVRKKLSISENNLRLMILQAPVALAILRDDDFKVSIANKFALEIWGRNEEQVQNVPLLEAMPELVPQGFEEFLSNTLKTGERFSTPEMPVELMRNGKKDLLYINFSFNALYNGEGEVDGIMAIGIDITDQVLSRKQIQENEEKLQLIIDASFLGVWDLNLKTQHMVASERCYEILGFSDEENLTPDTIITHVHPDDLELRAKSFEKAYQTGTLNYKLRVIWEDGSLHWKEVKGKVFYDENNEPERMLGTVRDITEERNFHQQLLDREEKFRLLADSMPQHIWTSDPEGNLNYFNKSVFDYSGLTLQQIEKDGWIQIVHPDDREENLKQWKHSIDTGEDFLIEHRFRKHDGTYRWQLSRAIPQKDKEGNIKMWVGTSTDIQEQKMFANELENMVQLRTNELRQKNIDLETMNKELQSFVYISSHDLQEPLRKIQIFSSRIKEKELEVLSENAKNYFSRMQKAAHRMQTLIQDLIAYSRTNTKDNNFEIVCLQDIIDDTKETLSEELEEHTVTFNVKGDCLLKVIPVQFNQVMLNLISNSIKFSVEDRPVIISIMCQTVLGKDTGIPSLDANKDYSQITVSDNGIGFDEQYSQKIFEVFQRLHNKDAYTGTGIGLAIVKRIIDNHEGAINAESKNNEGATFDIFIPAPDE
ncbi:PAS domain S-box protein [Winogradskyella ouciana]|uniref:histidine kinase n=1 Tax=Winogradskyella ouciana TaxID=2608631 RepID=A0A7K1GA92_9FLAO|nr:PAS domain S-box protein [Winogradskyella ouciana]MTE25945.1 PAS domain S-box protein [Winogradskyella ouciana]